MGSMHSILTNLSSLSINNTLSRNKKAADKNSRSVASGMKIVSAKDDSSGYTISEKMRAKIRSLDQVSENSQNGKSALKVANGALETIKEMVTTLKERAIKAANDHNNDKDREAIQQEIEQIIEQIDETSLEAEFNGRSMLDGTFSLHSTVDNTPEGLVLRGLNTWWISESLDLIKESYGLDFSKATVKEMDVKLANEGASGTLAYVTSTYSGGDATGLSLTVNMDYFTNISSADTNGGGNPAQYLDRVVAHEMTHAVTRALLGGSTSIAWYMEGLAELTHGGDERVRSGSSVSGMLGAAQGNSGTSDMYGGGYIALRYLENQFGSGTIKNLNTYLVDHRPVSSSTLDDAINAVSGRRIPNQAALFTTMNTNLTAAGNDDSFLRGFCQIDLTNSDTGSLVGTDTTNRHGIPLTPEGIIDEGGGTYGRLPTGETRLNGLDVKWPTLNGSFFGGLILQTGTGANQKLILEVDKIDAGTLGLKNIDLRTQYSAERAIDKLDKAVNKVTRQATLVGSYSSRLDFTIANITSSQENTIASESTIRDADMGKEMMSYTKNQLLTQSAQAMLAQSSQNAQSILQLLQ